MLHDFGPCNILNILNKIYVFICLLRTLAQVAEDIIQQIYDPDIGSKPYSGLCPHYPASNKDHLIFASIMYKISP